MGSCKEARARVGLECDLLQIHLKNVKLNV